MRKFSAILLNLVFVAASIIMPYGNFQDDLALHTVYNDLQQQDPDLNIGEFIFEKLLVFGQFLEHDDEDDELPVHPIPANTVVLQLQTGSIVLTKFSLDIESRQAPPEKPTCHFKDISYFPEYHPSIFHPPSSAA
ncbi:MAG: hypothetical protein GC171_13715 [Terrimonas sp.]|nr:hypothetical protein [Terrimonas sp.]